MSTLNFRVTIGPEGVKTEREPEVCRCGEVHDDGYGAYVWGHHNCFHETPLIQMDTNLVGCPFCGLTWPTEPPDPYEPEPPAPRG